MHRSIVRIPQRILPMFVVAILLVSLVMITTALRSGATAPTWSQQSVPAATYDDIIQPSRVTCVSTTFCMSVGSRYDAESNTIPAAQTWNGVAWTDVSSTMAPNPSTNINYAFDVSCTSTSFCMASGSGNVTWEWNGASWTSLPASLGQSDRLYMYAISCSSPTFCVEAGTDIITNALVAATWDGSNWTASNLVVPTGPGSTPMHQGLIFSLSCPTSTSCEAAGFFTYHSGGYTYPSQRLIESFDGANWTIPTYPQVADGYLTDISCESAGSCMATGTAGTALTLRSGTWSDASEVSQSANFEGVSCTSDTHCVTSAFYSGEVWLETWDGASWTTPISPISPAQTSAISCATATNCVMTYQATSPAEANSALWTGGATAPVTAMAPTTTTAFTEFYASTCSSGTDCWLLGSQGGHGFQGVLGDHFVNGTVTQVSMPTIPNDDGSEIVGATCVTSSDCWAVGDFYSTTNYENQLLAEHWNGTSWTVNSPANVDDSTSDFLKSISCASSNDCMAVGYTNNYVLVAEHWNGSNWTASTPLPSDPNNGGTLYGVACPAANNCTAVGVSYTNAGADTLVTHWDGNAWTIQTAPSPGGASPSNQLNGITCTSTSDCTAVGYTYDGSYNQALILQLSGGAWTDVSPSSQTADTFLNSVTCVAPGSCEAVGTQSSNGGVDVIASLDSGTWTISTSTNPSDSTSTANLYSVASASDGMYVAAGSYVNAVGLNLASLFTAQGSVPPTTVVPTTSGPSGDSIFTPLSGTPNELTPGNGALINADRTVTPLPVVVDGPNSISISNGSTGMTLRGGTLTGNTLTIALGGLAHSTGFGFQPGSTVSVWMMSNPTEVTTTTVAADGTYSVDFIVPTGIGVGSHTVQVQGNGQDGRMHALQVGVIVSAGLAATGSPLLPLGVFGVVTSTVGIVLLSLRRRVRHF